MITCAEALERDSGDLSGILCRARVHGIGAPNSLLGAVRNTKTRRLGASPELMLGEPSRDG